MATPKKCLIVDQMHPSIIPMLEALNYEVHYLPDITIAEVRNSIRDYTGLVVRSKLTINKELLEGAEKLKFIARAGAGLDQIDVEGVESLGVKIFNAPEGNRDAVAEHTLGLILGLLNKINSADKQIREGIWNRSYNRGVELMGKTVSLIGYGHMGQAVAKRLKSFQCEVLAFDKFKSGYSDDYATEVPMSRIFDETDILSLHIPLNVYSRALVDQEFINNFKKSIFIINTARGEVLKLDALIDGLESGKIKGAGLDVLENEKITPESLGNPQLDYLFKSEKVILTPHVAGWSEESYIKINEVLVEKIRSANI